MPGDGDMDSTIIEVPAAGPEVAASRIPKLPAFWKEEPEVWFLQVEASFQIAGVTQDTTKFQYLVAHLDQSVLFIVKDIIISPPSSEKYNALKKRIIDSYAVSSEIQLKKLLGGIEIGDDKPSHFLQRMKSLSGGQVNNDILRTLFLERLPDKIKTILAVCDGTDVDKLALQADKISEAISNSTYFVSAVSTSNNSGDELSRKLDQIMSRIESLESRSRSHHRTDTPARLKSRDKSQNRKDSNLCWYHWRFANKATKCIGPCNFSQSKN